MMSSADRHAGTGRTVDLGGGSEGAAAGCVGRSTGGGGMRGRGSGGKAFVVAVLRGAMPLAGRAVEGGSFGEVERRLARAAIGLSITC